MVVPPEKERDILPEFQQFLLDKKLAPTNRISFLAYWVARYLSFIRKQKASADDYREDLVTALLEHLRADPRIKDWQPRRAEDDLRLYYVQYLGKSRPGGSRHCSGP